MTKFPHEIRVAIADDHVLVRTGIKTIVDSIPGVCVVAEAGHGAELLQLLESTSVDVVLMDLTMPGIDGLGAIEQARRQHPGVRILVLSMHQSAEAVNRAISAGASGYITKEASDAELEQALRAVHAHGNYLTPTLSQRLLQWARRDTADGLTDRQIEIIKLLAKGMAAKEIGFKLGLSSRTVDVHRARIMKRLALSGTADLTRYALRKGLIDNHGREIERETQGALFPGHQAA